VWIYLATAEGELREGDEGELAWIPTRDLSTLALHEGDRVFLPWLEQRGVVFSARFDYEGGRFLGHEVAFYPRA